MQVGYRLTEFVNKLVQAKPDLYSFHFSSSENVILY